MLGCAWLQAHTNEDTFHVLFHAVGFVHVHTDIPIMYDKEDAVDPCRYLTQYLCDDTR
jgi:hypothetical protein